MEALGIVDALPEGRLRDKELVQFCSAGIREARPNGFGGAHLEDGPRLNAPDHEATVKVEPEWPWAMQLLVSAGLQGCIHGGQEDFGGSTKMREVLGD